MTQPPSGQPQPSEPLDNEGYPVATIGAQGRNAIRRSMGPMEPEQGQPQQEPAHPLDVCYNCDHHKDVHRSNGCKVCQCSGFQPPIVDEQERQAGGHRHVLAPREAGKLWCCALCDLAELPSWWEGYNQGVVDSAARRQ